MILMDLYKENPESYYHLRYNVERLFPADITRNETEACRNFLHNHYIEGRKLGLLRGDLYNQYIENGKHVHSASLYLLGKALMPCFENELNRVLSSFLPNYDSWHDHGYDLLYTWYLPSMFHDYASCVELGTILPNDTERRRSLDFHLGNNNVQYSLYEDYPYHTSNVPIRFSQDLIKNYFYYRTSAGICEHGILAGYLFFDHFVKNFLEKTEDVKFDTQGNGKAWGLTWNTDLIMFAAYAADAVICHNLWMAGSENAEIYKAYGLTPLLWQEHPENKLSIYEYPLQFMLCLLDTIEPTKRFTSMQAYEILHKISIQENTDCKGLTIMWDQLSGEKAKEDLKKWHNGIMGMKDWMDIECIEIDTHTIQIKW